MMITRALGGFGLGLCLLTPAVLAQADCNDFDWYRNITQQLKDLQRQIDQVHSHYFSGGAIVVPTSRTSSSTSRRTPTSSTSKRTSTKSSLLVSKTFSSLSSTLKPTRHSSDPEFTPGTAITRVNGAPSSTIKPSQLPRPISTMSYSEGYKAVAYYTDWSIYARGYEPAKIPADKVTHVLYSFADVRSDTGEVILTDKWSDTDKHWPNDSWNDVGNNLYGGLKQMNLLKKKNRNMKMLLSIGGWTYAHEQKHFDVPASTPQGRQMFADSCIKMIQDYGFDGIDIDWEYPQNTTQGSQLCLLVEALRAAMEKYSNTLAQKYGSKPHFLISIAAPAGEDNYKNLQLARLAGTLDFINLMCYDYSGSWDKSSGHQANLFASKSCPTCTPFNTDKVVADYINNGVPPHKLVIGMPLYGRAFTHTKAIGQPYNGIGAPDNAGGSWEAGVWDYKSLPRPGAKEYYDKEAGATYSYDNATQTLISYDNVDMAKRKAQYIMQHNLGGAMWWELSGDKTGESSIVTNVVRELGGADGGKIEKSANWLTFPDSQYDNVKKGFPNE